MPLVRINAPEWYDRADWKAWLDYTGPKHPATWKSPGEGDENDDVFFTFYDGDGSDAPEDGSSVPFIPRDIWQQITDLMKQSCIDECLIWVSNLRE